MQKVHKYLLKNLLEITCRGCESMQAMKWGTKIKVTTMHNTANKSISEILEHLRLLDIIRLK